MALPYRIAPSILAANMANLEKDVRAAVNCGVELLHVDVMDNHFVPNLTFGPMVCAALRKCGITTPMEVHLMAEPVERLIEDTAAAGAFQITVHAEASRHVDRCLRRIIELGCAAGLALNPATPLDCIEEVYPLLESVLIMTINPGFGGQKLLPESLGKLRRARALADRLRPSLRIAVDGGVTTENMAVLAAAGADTFVAGTAVFGSDDVGGRIAALRSRLAEHASTSAGDPSRAPRTA